MREMHLIKALEDVSWLEVLCLVEKRWILGLAGDLLRRQRLRVENEAPPFATIDALRSSTLRRHVGHDLLFKLMICNRMYPEHIF